MQASRADITSGPLHKARGTRDGKENRNQRLWAHGPSGTSRGMCNPDFEFVHINEIGGNATTAAHLLEFDSQHGRWGYQVAADDHSIVIDGKRLSYSSNAALEETTWGDLGVDLVIECTGKFKSSEKLAPYLQARIRRITAMLAEIEKYRSVGGVGSKVHRLRYWSLVHAKGCTIYRFAANNVWQSRSCFYKDRAA